MVVQHTVEARLHSWVMLLVTNDFGGMCKGVSVRGLDLMSCSLTRDGAWFRVLRCCISPACAGHCIPLLLWVTELVCHLLYNGFSSS